MRPLRQRWEMPLKLFNILRAVSLRSSLNEPNEITLSSVSNSFKVQCSNRERMSLLTCWPIINVKR